jgi:hypothetical protein
MHSGQRMAAFGGYHQLSERLNLGAKLPLRFRLNERLCDIDWTCQSHRAMSLFMLCRGSKLTQLLGQISVMPVLGATCRREQYERY